MNRSALFRLAACFLWISTAIAAEEALLTVAVLDFEAAGVDARLGESIPTQVTEALSKEPNLALLSRDALSKVMKEHSLSLAGLTDAPGAARFGKLLSARILIAGRMYMVGDELWISARIISTESGRVETVFAKGAATGPVGRASPPAKTIVELNEKIAARLRGIRAGAAAPPAHDEKIARLRESLGAAPRPMIQLIVVPRPGLGNEAAQIARTELARIARRCGFEIITGPPELAAAWIAASASKETKPPAAAPRVKIVVVAEIGTRAAPREGELAGGLAQLTVTAFDAANGAHVADTQAAGRGLDATPRTAGWAAIEEAAIEACAKILPDLLKAK